MKGIKARESSGSLMVQRYVMDAGRSNLTIARFVAGDGKSILQKMPIVEICTSPALPVERK